MLAQTYPRLRARCRPLGLNPYSRRRMPYPRALRHARPDEHDVGDRIPFAVQLANLLRIHIQDQRYLMITLALLRLHIGQVKTAARCGIQDAHQGSLCIAIADMKALHDLSPYCVGSSSSNISDSAAPAGTIGNTLASGAQSNTSNSGSGECRNRSIWSPGSCDTGNSRMTSSFM